MTENIHFNYCAGDKYKITLLETRINIADQQ